MFYADALAFLQPPIGIKEGKPFLRRPIRDPKAKLHLAHLTAAPPYPFVKSMGDLQEYLNNFLKDIGDQPTSIRLITTGNQQLELERTTAIVLGIQDPPDDIDIAAVRKSGVSILQIAYSRPNRFGCGVEDPSAHLTDEGQKFIERCAEERIILDLSHAGHATARDALDFIDKARVDLKVMASHTGCYNLYPHNRNLPDDILWRVADHGGVVGIYTLTFGLAKGRSDLGPFTEHILHAIKVCGEDHVAIGSDGYYTTEGAENARARYGVMGKAIAANQDVWRAEFPDLPPELDRPDRMEIIAHRLSYFLPTRTVQKVVGTNLLAFFKGSLPTN